MGRTLTEEQELRIQKLICEKRPEQLKMDFALWPRGAVKELIQRELGFGLSIRAVGDYHQPMRVHPTETNQASCTNSSRRQYANGLMKNIRKSRKKPWPKLLRSIGVMRLA